jgi:hypothetical protein
MKKIILSISMFLTAIITGYGAMLDAGTLDLQLSAGMDFDNPEGDVEFSGGTALGYFIYEDVEVGGLMRMGFTESDFGMAIGPFAEALIDCNYAIAPYIGGGIAYVFGDYYGKNCIVCDLYGGLKFFLTEYLAVFSEVFYEIASTDRYINNQKKENNDMGIRMGISHYF